MNTAEQLFIKELSLEFVKHVDIFNALISELVAGFFTHHESRFAELKKENTRETVTTLLDDSLPKGAARLMTEAMVSLTRAISVMCLMKVLLEHNTEDTLCKFNLLFIMRLKALNYGYFKVCEVEVAKMEESLKTNLDSSMVKTDNTIVH